MSKQFTLINTLHKTSNNLLFSWGKEINILYKKKKSSKFYTQKKRTVIAYVDIEYYI